MGTIVKDTIQNGSEILSVFKDDGVVRRTRDIADFQEFIFTDIPVNTYKLFDLSVAINKHYEITGMNPRLASNTTDSYTSVTGNTAVPDFKVEMLKIRDSKIVDKLSLRFTEGFRSMSRLYLSPGDVIAFLSPLALSSVHVYGFITYFDTPIVVPVKK